MKSSVRFISMPEGEDWLLRPVLENLCSYENLKNGVLDIADVSRLNDAIDVRNYNIYVERTAQ